MSEDIRRLMESIVARVLERLQSDPELAPYFHQTEQKPAAQWARTCSTFREPSEPVSRPAVVKRLYSERDILDLVRQGVMELVVDGKTVFTPSARDAAAAKGLTIRIKD